MKKNLSSKHKMVWGLLIAAGLISLSLIILLYSGFCWKEKRYLTTQEKFDLAVTSIIAEKTAVWVDDDIVNEAGEKISSSRLVQKYNYSSLEEFYAMNPDCCKFVKEFSDSERDYTIPLGKKISGRLNDLIEVRFIFAFDEQNNNQPIYRVYDFGLSRCGKLYSGGETASIIGPNW